MTSNSEQRRLALTQSEIDCLIALCRMEPATLRALGRSCTSQSAAGHAVDRLLERGLVRRYKEARAAPRKRAIADELAGQDSNPKGKPPYLHQLTVPGRKIATELWRAAQALKQHDQRQTDEERGRTMLRDPYYARLR